MLKLEVVEEGVLNAVAFWFDLHLDDCETLTNGALRWVDGVAGAPCDASECMQACLGSLGPIFATTSSARGASRNKAGGPAISRLVVPNFAHRIALQRLMASARAACCCARWTAARLVTALMMAAA